MNKNNDELWPTASIDTEMRITQYIYVYFKIGWTRAQFEINLLSRPMDKLNEWINDNMQEYENNGRVGEINQVPGFAFTIE